LNAIVVVSMCLLFVAFVYEKDPGSDMFPPPPPVQNTFEMSYTFDNFAVPNLSTNYFCKGFYLPDDMDYHIITVEPIKDNQEMLHHMIFYATVDYVGDDYFHCSEMPAGSTPLLAWAVGAKGVVLPDNVGIRIGKTAGRYAALQIHYDNPNMWSGRTDSSGVKVTLTSELRPMDLGYFLVGAWTKPIRIPPALPYFEITSECETDSVLNKTAYKHPEYSILMAGLHMHLMGRQMYTEQFRPDPETGELVSLGVIGCDDFFNYNDQTGSPPFTNVTIRPGDRMITHCMYDSTMKTTTTIGCESTECEMCLNFLLYYPKMPDMGTVLCLSDPIVSANTDRQLHCGSE